MKRVLAMLTMLAVFIGLYAVMTGIAYVVGGFVEKELFTGASRLVNLLILMLVVVMGSAALLTMGDRKWGALIQDRIGPNRARIDLPILRNTALGGIPHFLADGAKMLFKEDHLPAAANKLLYNMGPMLAFGPAFALFAVVPTGPSVSVFG
ncbi:MAG TPA: NADH-quinone oxidoreductase subunit H, partial [Cystobacter sp.]